MSKGKFWKLSKRFWANPAGRGLSERERLVAVYCLTEQTNRVGIFPFSVAKAAEDLGLSARQFEVAFTKVCEAFSWKWDSHARVLWLPGWWRHNIPDNADALKAFLQDLVDVPASPLVDAFVLNCQDIPEKLHTTFDETIHSLRPPPYTTGCRPPCPSPHDQGGTHTRQDLNKTETETIQDTDKSPAADDARASNKAVSHNGHAYAELFEQFWAAYPRKEGKGAAEDWFLEKKPNKELVEQMLATIQVFAASEQWKEHGGKYIPHPTTWLNEKRWGDQLRVRPSPRRIIET